MSSSHKWVRFRFGLRTLLALPLIVGGVWWWGTWPDRTARQFVALLSEGKVEAAKSMLRSQQTELAPNEFDIWSAAERHGVRLVPSTVQGRSAVDVLAGRGNFTVRSEFEYVKLQIYFGEFMACRGYVQPLNTTGQQASFRGISLNNIDVESAMSKLQTKFAPTSPVKLAVNERGNSIIVMGDEAVCGQLETMLKELDNKASPSNDLAQ